MKPARILLAVLVAVTGQALAHGGLAKVSVYDRTEGRRLQVYWHQGRGYVVGKPGNDELDGGSPDPVRHAEAREALARFAAATGTNEEAAKSRLRYAIAKLKAAVEDG